jgi:competence protein ComEC
MKIINYRPILFVAISLLLGVMVGGLVYNNTDFIMMVPIALIAMGIFLYFIFKNKLVFLLILFFTIGMVGFFVDYSINFSGDVNEENVYTTCRVKEIKNDSLIIEDLCFDGVSYKGYAELENLDYDIYEIGDNLTFMASITTNSIDIFDTYQMSLYNDKIYYSIVAGNYVDKESGELKFFESLKQEIIAPIIKYMPEEESGISISLLFGDKSFLTSEDSTTINGIGMSHIFAVSGMHIGFLIAFIIFICKKLRVNPTMQLVIISFVLIFYGGLTSFPAGVKRAGIMSFIYLLSVILRRKNDNLTTLSLAVILIIVTNFRELFDIGFIMSVSAVLGIICFYRPINKFLLKKSFNKTRKYFSSTIAVTLSANVFLIPICFNVFNSLATYMIISNLIILPLVSLAYFVLMFVVIVSLIFSKLGILHIISSYFVTLIRLVANLIYSLPNTTITVASLGVGTVFYLLIAFIYSQFIMIDKRKKLIINSTLSSIGALLFIIL